MKDPKRTSVRHTLHSEPTAVSVDLAKQRIWKSLEAKLPDRSHPEFSPVFAALREATGGLKLSLLKKVQAKEHLLDLLPEREVFGTVLFPSRLLSLGTLGLLLGVLFVPFMDLTPRASATSQNTLELVGGEVFVNGIKVDETSLLQVGDTVRTGDGSMAHLTFLDDSRLTLGPSSFVTLQEAWVNPENRTESRVGLLQSYGRSWSQILNLTETGTFTVEFPQGKVWVSQRASFDLHVSDELATVGVARNLVELEVNAEEGVYSGVLGQGAELLISDEIESREIGEDVQKDVWWTFNLAYGKSYARTLDETYQKENISHALILPGNPLYALKTFREDLQVSFAFTSTAKQTLLIQQAESRLNEAQVLLAQGNMETAAEVFKVYQETVDAVAATNVSEEPSEKLLALEDEAQKQALTVHDGLEESQVFGSSMDSAVSLQMVSDLIAEGDYDAAVSTLKIYEDSLLSLLTQLETVTMEEREAFVSDLLDQKLEDLKLLKVIASMPELPESVDLNASMLKELSVMALSLREKELGDLNTYFEMNDVDIVGQEALYERLKDDAEMTPALEEQFEEVQMQIETPATSVVIDIRPVEEETFEVAPEVSESVDPRFEVETEAASVPHSDQAQNEAQG